MSLLDVVVYVDGHFWVRTGIKTACLLGVGCLSLAPLFGGRTCWWRRSWLFFLFLALSLLVYRSPVLFFPNYIDVDEAQMLSQAITYQSYPMPWRDIDGTTSGPLNSYVLLWCAPFGIKPSYLTGRVAGLFCLLIMMVFLCRAGSRMAGALAGRLAILPAFLFLCFTTEIDFIHFSSEQVSLVLLSGALYLLTRLRRTPEAASLPLSLGLVLGLLPLAKLQSCPPGAALGLMAAWLIWKRASTPAAALPRLLILVVSATAPGALLLVLVAHAGALGDFWQSYIRMAGVYGVHYDSFVDKLNGQLFGLGTLLFPAWDVALPIYLAAVPTLLLGFCALTGKVRMTRATWQWYVFAGFLSLSLLVTIFFTGNFYGHYLFYLLPGLTLLTLVNFRLLRTGLRRNRPRALGLLEEAAIPVGLLAAFVLFFNIAANIGFSALSFPVTSFLILPLPLATLTGAMVVGARLLTPAPGHPVRLDWRSRQRFMALACFTVFFVAPALALSLLPNPMCGKISEFIKFPPSEMDQAILRVRPPGGRLAIWGWAPEYSAETDTPLGTRDSISQFLIKAGPLQDYYRQRYLRDLQANRPALFLEATGPENFYFNDPQRDGIESFPALASLVSAQYKLNQEVNGMRLFIRRDLLAGDGQAASRAP